MRYSHSRKTFVKNAAKDLTDSDIGNSIISSPVQSSTSTRPPTPTNSDNEDEMTEDQKRHLAGAKKRSTRIIPRCTSAPGTAPPRKVAPMPDPEERFRKERQDARDFREMLDNPRPSQASESKAVAPPVAPADQPTGAKAPQPTKGQQVPKQPMTTRKRTRAGGFRPGVAGSGQTDTCVASSHPSKT
jgi:hypothetical protein